MENSVMALHINNEDKTIQLVQLDGNIQILDNMLRAR
jgi:hypothetical protein